MSMILVTGASKGLGKEIGLRLQRQGFEVCGLARTQAHTDFELLECDVSSITSIKSAVRHVKGKNSELTAVINAAGVASMNMAVTTDEKTVVKLINTNLIGTINVCQRFAPLMFKRKSGSIINFSTIAVALGLKGESVYAASKAGVEAFSRAFAREAADFNVRVNCIAPGPIRTDLLRGVTDAQISRITERQVIQREFLKSDVSDVVELLLDPKSSSISGQVVHIGGV